MIFFVFGPGKPIQHSHGPQAVLWQAHDGNDKAKQEKKLCPTRVNVTELRVVGKDLPTSTAIQMQSYGKTKQTTPHLGNRIFLANRKQNQFVFYIVICVSESTPITCGLYRNRTR